MQNDVAIVVALRSDMILSGLVTSIGHGLVPPSTPAPYVIVQDSGGDDPIYGFGNREFASDGLYTIEVVTVDTEDKSAQTVAQEILNRIFEVLQNAVLTIEGRLCMNLRRMGRTGSSWEKGEGDGEVYYIDGHRWAIMTQPI